MNTMGEPEDRSNDIDDDEEDSWILNEAAEWASLSEINSQKNALLSTLKVESESKNAANTKQDVVKPNTSIEIDKIKRHQQALFSQPSVLRSSPPTSLSQKDSFSLHVTQISYNATEDDIRQHFVQAGCIGVQAVRLVYDFSEQKSATKAFPKKKFRGVAFVDLSDEQSYQNALQKLHGSLLLSRKINVRPVKSKVELSNIVLQTRTIVSEKIRSAKEKKLQSDGSNDKTKKMKISPQKRKKGQESLECNDNDIQFSPSKRKRESGISINRPDTHLPSNPTKLTKQQRNRRAAILLSKRKS